MNDAATKRNSRLTRRIMRRIYFVYALRAVLNPLFLKALIASVFFWRSTAYISYANVIENAPRFTDVPRNLAFLRDAFMHADVMAVGLLLGVMVLGAWLVSDFLHKTQHSYF